MTCYWRGIVKFSKMEYWLCHCLHGPACAWCHFYKNSRVSPGHLVCIETCPCCQCWCWSRGPTRTASSSSSWTTKCPLSYHLKCTPENENFEECMHDKFWEYIEAFNKYVNLCTIRTASNYYFKLRIYGSYIKNLIYLFVYHVGGVPNIEFWVAN